MKLLNMEQEIKKIYNFRYLDKPYTSLDNNQNQFAAINLHSDRQIVTCVFMSGHLK